MSIKSSALGFTSATATGTGSSQNIAHNLGMIPGKVFVLMDSIDSKVYTLGTHTAKNVVLTVTNGATFKIWALPPDPEDGR